MRCVSITDMHLPTAMPRMLFCANMRALSLVFLLFVTTASFAEGIVGKTRILVTEDCTTLYWVPIAGGTIEPIWWWPAEYDRNGCPRGIGAAYDGERFLINFAGRTAALFEEGATEPVSSIPLDENSMLTSSRVRWDGTRYLTAWRGSAGRFASLRGAAITRDGVIDDTFQIAGRRVAGLAVNNGQVLVLDAPGQESPLEFPLPERMQVSATVLDPGLTPRKSLVVGNSYESFAIGWQFGQYVDVLDAVPFRDGFYVAWTETDIEWGGDLDPAATILGARIAADGTLLGPIRTLARNAPSRDVDLMTVGEHLLAVVKREDTAEAVMGVWIDKNGLPIGTRQLLGTSDDERIIETVRLPDGKLALLTKPRFGFAATVTPINDAPPLPRRRAVR